MLDKDSKKGSKKAASSKKSNKPHKTQQSKKSSKPKSNKSSKKVASKTSNKSVKKVNKNIATAKVKTKTNTKVHEENKSSKKIAVLSTFIILCLCLIGSAYYLLKSPQFNISAIVVSGNTKVNIDNIITNSGIKLGDNVLKGFFKVNKENILAMPYISDVKASIKFPSELALKVVERKSIYFAFDKEKNLYYRLDENGIILEICDRIDLKEQELLVNGITFDNEVKLGTKINEIDFSKILVYKNIENEFMKAFPDEKITKVSFENSLTKIYLNEKVEVILPNDTNLQYNLTVLKDIINNVGDVIGTIDMTKENPTFISF